MVWVQPSEGQYFLCRFAQTLSYLEEAFSQSCHLHSATILVTVAISSEAPIPPGLHEVLVPLLSSLPPGMAALIPFNQGDMCAFKT